MSSCTGLIQNGGFDRLRKLKIIVGYRRAHVLRLPMYQPLVEDVMRPVANEEGRVMAEKTIYDYFK
jgi:2,3-dihydroxybenzoate decarboxylase